MVYGYLRLYKEKTELIKQKNAIEKYVETHGLELVEFIEVETYSKKTVDQKRIDFLLSKVTAGDTLVLADLFRLGRNMLEILNLIAALRKVKVSLAFANQPELNTTEENPNLELLQKVFGYFAETERAFISTRTKEGLAAVKAKGIKLGRPKGHKNKERALDDHRDEIMGLLNLGINLTAIRKIVNQKMSKGLSYSSYKYFIDHDEELLHAKHNYDKNSLFH